ncbi:hypothetical protein C8J56DRAFT_796194, partial [Mycena floridula]
MGNSVLVKHVVTASRVLNAFFKIPHLSWANGCWIGAIPAELGSLTYAEELVIARARCTKCWIRLTAGSGPQAQRAAHGNVCIHPQEITTLAKVLPRPVSTLYDEIIDDCTMIIDRTPETQQHPRYKVCAETPFLVRRGMILRALQWLKLHNRLYRDIEIDLTALAEYPDDHIGRIPFHINHQKPTSTIRSQSSTSSVCRQLGLDPNSESGIPISASGTFDVKDTAVALNLRKIRALQHLKAGGAFVKSSTTPETLFTRNNPDVYGMLWPTLFPYGIGMFEDPVRSKAVALKTQVK